MEEQTNIEYLVIACAVVFVFFVIAFILFVIIQKIHQHKLKAVNDILEAQNNEEINRIKLENKEIKKDLASLKENISELKRK